MILDRFPGMFVLPAAILLLSACGGGAGGGKGSPAAPPTNVVVTPADQAVAVAWDDLPNVQYWVFIGPPGTNPSNFASITGGYAFPNVNSPFSISTVALNNASQSLINGQQYTVTINARTDSGSGGPATTPITVTPRPAGAVWSTSGVLVNSIDGAADALYGSAFGLPLYDNNGLYQLDTRPAQFVFVGHNGAAYYSTVNPASGLTYTQTAVNSGIPAGNDLNAVAYGSDAGYLAGGTGGLATLSLDGITWYPQTTGLTSTIRSITSTSATGFIVTGDNCLVAAASTGGTGQITAWANYTAGFTSSGFASVCSGSNPISLLGTALSVVSSTESYVTAVGTAGTIAFTTNYGVTTPTWALASPTFPAGATNVNLRSIVYGVYYETLSTGNLGPLPLWVVVGDYTDSGNVVRPLILYTTAPPTFNSAGVVAWNSWQIATLPAGLTGSLHSVTGLTDPNGTVGEITQLVAVGDNGLVLRQQLATPVFTSTGAYASTNYTTTPAATWTTANSVATGYSLYNVGHGNFGFQVIGAGGFWEWSY